MLAEHGARALTHRAADRAAGLPAGSTSNVFRTRTALIDGVFQLLIDQELSGLPPIRGEALPAIDEEFLVALAGQAIDHALGAGRRYTLARRALFLEATHDAGASERLTRGSEFWWDILTNMLQRAGAPDPARRARALLAYVDGVISDQLARPEADFDPAAAIQPAIRGLLLP